MKSPRKSFSESIAARGINAAKAIALLKRRERYALTCDRAKVFASTPLGSIPVLWRNANARGISMSDISADLMTLKLANDGLISTPDYVAAWCRLNHLKP